MLNVWLLVGLATTAALLLTVAIVVPIEVSRHHDTESAVNMLSSSPPNNIYALLVAGSSGIENYRHQADVAHAYHLLIGKGIPRDNIVVMMFDDIVNHPSNPHRGELRNSPNGEDYYKGLRIDYRGSFVCKAVFRAVLTGNASALKGIGSGRVLKSTSADNVFVFYSDHGGDSILGMPNGDYLSKSYLQDSIEKASFAQMAVYIESCESASMLKGMENNGKVYGMTASAATEPSYAAECYGICYADEFSIQWIVDSENFDLNSHDLGAQFGDVATRVTHSSVQHFGLSNLSAVPVSHFQGAVKGVRGSASQKNGNVSGAFINARDVPLYYYQYVITSTNNETEREDARKMINEITQNRRAADLLMSDVLESTRTNMSSNLLVLKNEMDVEQADECYLEMVETFHANCMQLGQNPYMAQLVTQLRSLVYNQDCSQLKEKVRDTCSPAKHPNKLQRRAI